jgi:hypothetical protein
VIEADTTTRSLAQISEEEGAKLKFPEYVDLSRNFSSIDTFDISLVLPDHLG